MRALVFSDAVRRQRSNDENYANQSSARGTRRQDDSSSQLKDLMQMTDSKNTDISLWKANYNPPSPRVRFTKRYQSEAQKEVSQDSHSQLSQNAANEKSLFYRRMKQTSSNISSIL